MTLTSHRTATARSKDVPYCFLTIPLSPPWCPLTQAVSYLAVLCIVIVLKKNAASKNCVKKKIQIKNYL